MVAPVFALRTDQLHRSFGKSAVIRGLDLRVPAGTVYGFLGRNGAGKTTAIRMIMGILQPDAGTLTFGAGAPVRRTAPSMRRGIGYVSQQQHFYPWMRVRRLASFVGAFYPTWDRARFERLCERLAVPLWQRTGELSGGTRMKLALALAMAPRPPLLVLDEPTAGVDPVTRREILDALRAVVTDEGTTVFFSTHQIAELEAIGDQVGILHDGALFFQGPVAELGARVRRVPGGELPGVRRLPDDLVWGEPDAVAALGGEPVSLEEAFVAIARLPTARR
jgi:ABC-2 type transport system ATP-binding protein